MNPDNQKTAFKDITTVSNSSEHQITNTSTSGDTYTKYFSIPLGLDFLKRAWEVVYKIEDTQLANEAQKFLLIIQKNLAYLQEAQVDLNHLSFLNASIVEDSILFEYVHRDYRFGFIIESSLEHSSWYIVTNKKFGDSSSSGVFTETNLDGLIFSFLNFIILNS
jgi:hypothetical protein